MSYANHDRGKAGDKVNGRKWGQQQMGGVPTNPWGAQKGVSPFPKSEAKGIRKAGRGWGPGPQELFSQQKTLKLQVSYTVSDFPRTVWQPALDMMCPWGPSWPGHRPLQTATTISPVRGEENGGVSKAFC